MKRETLEREMLARPVQSLQYMLGRLAKSMGFAGTHGRRHLGRKNTGGGCALSAETASSGDRSGESGNMERHLEPLAGIGEDGGCSPGSPNIPRGGLPGKAWDRTGVYGHPPVHDTGAVQSFGGDCPGYSRWPAWRCIRRQRPVVAKAGRLERDRHYGSDGMGDSQSPV